MTCSLFRKKIIWIKDLHSCYSLHKLVGYKRKASLCKDMHNSLSHSVLLHEPAFSHQALHCCTQWSPQSSHLYTSLLPHLFLWNNYLNCLSLSFPHGSQVCLFPICVTYIYNLPFASHQYKSVPNFQSNEKFSLRKCLVWLGGHWREILLQFQGSWLQQSRACWETWHDWLVNLRPFPSWYMLLSAWVAYSPSQPQPSPWWFPS